MDHHPSVRGEACQSSIEKYDGYFDQPNCHPKDRDIEQRSLDEIKSISSEIARGQNGRCYPREPTQVFIGQVIDVLSRSSIRDLAHNYG